MRIILLGPPGAGKGTQSRFITETLQIPQIATGEMLRAAVAEGSELGKKLSSIMSSGELVPDDIMVRLVEQRIAQPDCDNGYLFDGFPRTRAQAEALRTQKIKIDFVINFEVPDDTIVERICGRLTHVSSGRVYHKTHNPPKVEGLDDETGEPLFQRDDDKEEIVRHRLEVYHKQTSPLIDYYHDWADSGDEMAPRYYSISGIGAVDEIKRRITDILG
ncbi:MAG: adenylate kinase [Gammaproteobacteria bacterium]|nr:adenylate kinase [Gammaproteobacteria bacterium]MCH9744237.1 adenylate kinase [Gammaproteobacteria bacterium]